MPSKECGLNSLHGKEVSFHHRVDQIKRTQFGIYDPSKAEKVDTFLEIGAALALGKKTLILCKRGASLPEAIKSLDRIEYIEYEDFPSLTEKLKKAIKL